MKSPRHTVEASIEESWPLSDWRSVHVVIAVSGGADSMALLRAIWTLKNQYEGPGIVTAVHVNHQLRGLQSDEDERWLAEQCQRLGARFVTRRVEVAGKAAEDGDGIESAARDLRYDVLTETAHTLGARFVATAHHREDQVETILFRLLRGTGLRGLRGMSRARPLSPSVTLIRPMLRCTREEILDYLVSIDQPFREDASNADNDFSRNRLRNELLPLLREEYNSGIDEALMRLSTQAVETYELVEQQARKLYERCRLKGIEKLQRGFNLSVGSLQDHSNALVIEVLRLAWRETGFPEQGMTDATWRLLAELSHNSHDGKKHSLPGDLLAQCDGRELRIYEAKQ